MLDLILATVSPDEAQQDAVKAVVLKFLASYGGLAAGVTFLISALKTAWPAWIKDKEPRLCIALTYLLGVAAKLATPFYGPSDFTQWALHAVILAFVAVGSAAFHNNFVNAIMGKGTTPPPAGG